MLSIENLSVDYDGIHALRDIHLHIDQGEIVTLIGANGAGKTTTLRAISGLVPLSAGKITYLDRSLTQYPTHDRVRLGIAHCPEGRHVLQRQTVAGNLFLGAYIRNDPTAIQADLMRIYQFFPRLQERQNQLAGTLSGGEQQMLAIGRALMSRPQLLLLDEPSLGLAPQIVKDIFRVIDQLKTEGVTILLVEQNAHLALEVADRGYVLEAGIVKCSGKATDLLQDKRVQEAYLG